MSAIRWPDTRAGRMVKLLEEHYGLQEGPAINGPFAWILWVIVGYLVDDERRGRAHAALRERTGFRPDAILSTPDEELESICRIGGAIAFKERAGRLRESAQRVITEWDGNLDAALRLPYPKAKKALMAFPMIGEPGAEQILLHWGQLPVLALESNGLRVMTRLGYGAEGRSYAQNYRAVREAVGGELPEDCALLVSASRLLRVHGQRTCLQNNPSCRVCPLRAGCPSARES